MQLAGYFRIPRCNAEPVIYRNWVIPPNTPVSMCPNFFHYDPDVYPEPDQFRPERWLDLNEKEICEKIWKPFGNGSRSCAGRHLGFEIVFRVTANIFSQFSIHFAGQDAEACKRDGMLKAFPVGSSKGLTVFVRDSSSPVNAR
jgi:cytochrome P450